MSRARVWTFGVIGLAAVWLVALAAMTYARAQAVTAEKVVATLRAADLEAMSDSQRRELIGQIAADVNRLSFEDRRDPRVQEELRDLFVAMTPQERQHYLDLVLPRGMAQMMDAINAMPRHERQAMVERALADMKRGMNDEDQQRAEREIGEETLQRIVDEGLRSYMRDASAESKLDLEPLITQMQRQMRRFDR